MKRLLVLVFTAALAVGSIGRADAEILYSDAFDRVTGSGDGNGDPNGAADNFSDWGTNDNALGGANSQAWLAGPSRAGGGRNAVTNGDLGVSHGTSSFYNFDAAAAAPKGFRVDLDFGRFVSPPANPGGGYIAFGLGVDAGVVSADLNDFTAIGGSDFGILFQQANLGNAANAEAFEDNASLGAFDYLDPVNPHSLTLIARPQVDGAYGAADLVDVTVIVDGTISQAFTTLGGSNFGSFAVSANNFDTRFIDNLVVRSIPEPTGLVLAGLAVVGRVPRRRFKCAD